MVQCISQNSIEIFQNNLRSLTYSGIFIKLLVVFNTALSSSSVNDSLQITSFPSLTADATSGISFFVEVFLEVLHIVLGP